MQNNYLESCSIIKLSDILIVTLSGELTDQGILNMQDKLLQEIASTEAKGLLIDVSGIELIDSFIARALIRISKMAKYMDARTIIAGISPEIALTLVKMGFYWGKVSTAISVEHGIELLQKSKTKHNKHKL